MIDNIIHNIEHYLSLRRFQEPDFARQLRQLQTWQHNRMSETYSDLQSSPENKELLHFFLDEIYRGIELKQLASKLEKTAKLLDKLFTDLQLIHLAIEFNAITGELDEILTSTLFEKMGVRDIDHKSYKEACQRAGLLERQLQQLDLIGRFAEETEDVVHNAIIYSAFKLARIPAKLGGLGSLHTMIDRGFNAIRQVDDYHSIIDQVLRNERDFYNSIYV